MRAKNLIALVFVILFAASDVFPSNFSIFENGVRAAGMGGAFVAIANDGSAIFYNAAGIAFQKGLRLEMDGLGVIGLFRFHPSAVPAGTIVPEKGYNLNVSPHLIPVSSMYISKDLSSRLTFGFGMFAPFGLASNATDFKDSDSKNAKFVGRFAGTRAKLESFWMQPTLAYRLTNRSSIGLGVAYIHTHLLIEQSALNPLDDGLTFGEQLASQVMPGVDKAQAARAIARMLPEGRTRIAATANKIGFNAGYLYKHEKYKTNFGLMWRSAVVHHLRGKASFAFTTGYPLETFLGKETIPNLFPKQNIKGTFVTPATFSIGLANSAFWNSTIALQVDIQDYQRLRDVPLNFSQTKDTATPAELRLKVHLENSYIVRFGFEKRIGEKMAVRAGYGFDHSPVLDASVGALFPDSSRNSFAVGISRVMGNKEFSFFYQATNFVDRTTAVADNNKRFTNGLYDNFAHLIGLGLRIHLGELLHPFDR